MYKAHCSSNRTWIWTILALILALTPDFMFVTVPFAFVDVCSIRFDTRSIGCSTSITHFNGDKHLPPLLHSSQLVHLYATKLVPLRDTLVGAGAVMSLSLSLSVLSISRSMLGLGIIWVRLFRIIERFVRNPI